LTTLRSLDSFVCFHSTLTMPTLLQLVGEWKLKKVLDFRGISFNPKQLEQLHTLLPSCKLTYDSVDGRLSLSSSGGEPA
jgi:hypothetical protein